MVKRLPDSGYPLLKCILFTFALFYKCYSCPYICTDHNRYKPAYLQISEDRQTRTFCIPEPRLPVFKDRFCADSGHYYSAAARFVRGDKLSEHTHLTQVGLLPMFNVFRKLMASSLFNIPVNELLWMLPIVS